MIIDPDKEIFYERKIVIIFLPINFKTCVVDAQKNRLIETVLLSTHNICFGREIKKIVFQYTLLSGGLIIEYSWGLMRHNMSLGFLKK